jgi:hypothetical protein
MRTIEQLLEEFQVSAASEITIDRQPHGPGRDERQPYIARSSLYAGPVTDGEIRLLISNGAKNDTGAFLANY